MDGGIFGIHGLWKVGFYDFIKFTETSEKYPSIHEIDIKDKSHYDDLIKRANEDADIVPIFTKSPDGNIDIMPLNYKEFSPNGEGYKLVYLGKVFESDI